MIALAVPFGVYFLSQRKFTKQIAILFGLAILSIGFMFYIMNNVEALLDSPIFRRAAVTYLSMEEGSEVLSGREYLWAEAWRMFRTSPILGVGVGAFNVQVGTEVHNMYLQILCEQGIVGFVLFAVSLLYCLIENIRLCRNSYGSDLHVYFLFVLANQLYFVLYGVTGNTNTDVTGYLMNALMIALMIDCKYRLKKRQKFVCA